MQTLSRKTVSALETYLKISTRQIYMESENLNNKSKVQMLDNK